MKILRYLKLWIFLPSRHSSVGSASALSHTVRQLWHDRPRTRARPMPTHRYMEEKSLAYMLTTKRSAGVTPEVNLREHMTLHQVWIRLPLWLWNPEEMSPEVQNRGITGPTKRTYVLQHFKKTLHLSGPVFQIDWNTNRENEILKLLHSAGNAVGLGKADGLLSILVII